ncbi:MAG: DUF58 domain-containing protein [Desulfuromonadaceae bacterium]
MAVSGLMGKHNLGRPQIQLVLPAEIYAGQPALVRIRLHNARRLPIFLLQVGLPGASACFHMVEGRASAEEEVLLRFPARGRQTIHAVQLRSIFPVNFFIRNRTVPVDLPILVFPRPRPCSWPPSGDPGLRQGENQDFGRGQQGDIQRIADYRSGEPLKQIHWKLSARSDQLLVKELAATTVEPVRLDLDLLPGTSLEERLGQAVFLVNHYLRQNRPLGLRLGPQRFQPATGRHHRLHLLTELGVYGQD